MIESLALQSPSRLLEAVHFAAERHRYQRRKDHPASAYINHPIEVAQVLSETGVRDEEVLLAALLHDTVEDTNTSFAEIEASFGSRVRGLVAEVTDDKSLPKAERKHLQLVHAPLASDGAKLIKLADKICNVRDLAQHPPAAWTTDRRLEYLLWASAVAAGCRGVHPPLDALFDRVLAESRAAITH